MSEQWSNWIEHKPGEPCPIPWAKAGEWQARSRTGGKGCSDAWADDCAERHQALIFVGAWEHRRDCWPVLRYRYRLDCAPAGFVPPGAEKPWAPEQQPGFGPWIECRGGRDGKSERPPFLVGATVLVLWWHERNCRTFFNRTGPRKVRQKDTWGRFVVAYCVKLEDQPTQEQVEATQKPETPEADASEDAKAANRPMFDADDVGVSAGKWDRFNARLAAPTAAPGFMVRAVRSSDGLLTVREADHRPGLWS